MGPDLERCSTPGGRDPRDDALARCGGRAARGPARPAGVAGLGGAGAGRAPLAAVAGDGRCAARRRRRGTTRGDVRAHERLPPGRLHARLGRRRDGIRGRILCAAGAAVGRDGSGGGPAARGGSLTRLTAASAGRRRGDRAAWNRGVRRRPHGLVSARSRTTRRIPARGGDRRRCSASRGRPSRGVRRAGRERRRRASRPGVRDHAPRRPADGPRWGRARPAGQQWACRRRGARWRGRVVATRPAADRDGGAPAARHGRDPGLAGGVLLPVPRPGAVPARHGRAAAVAGRPPAGRRFGRDHLRRRVRRAVRRPPPAGDRTPDGDLPRRRSDPGRRAGLPLDPGGSDDPGDPDDHRGDPLGDGSRRARAGSRSGRARGATLRSGGTPVPPLRTGASPRRGASSPRGWSTWVPRPGSAPAASATRAPPRGAAQGTPSPCGGTSRDPGGGT
ncbi:MAG: hypothetical protein QOJ30_3122 [Pseudonocardiales bacterium]|nr:hypothetical protein [Pseudonocardiales bacterium]